MSRRAPWLLAGLMVSGAATVFQPIAGAFGLPWDRFAKKDDAWYRSSEGRAVAGRVRSHQNELGGWPTDIDTSAAPSTKGPAEIRGTFDDGATTTELRFLARSYNAAKDAADRDAFVKGLDYVLAAQYPNGGWPQSFPPGKRYPRHITFNDNAMVNILELLREVARDERYAFVGAARRAASARAFDAAIPCILKCQVVQDGKKTVWCAQHDETTYEPRSARSFEPASLSGAESAWILRFLMSLEEPSPEVVEAIEAGVAWFDAVKLTGIREVRVDGDKRIVKDASAPALWARFYELGTGRPIFSGRDGAIKYDIAEIDPERRNGYAWYGRWGENVARDHEKWSKARGGKNR